MMILIRSYWEHQENRRLFFDWLAEKLQLDDYLEWANVENIQIVKNGGIHSIRL